ncbi:tRNA (adenosine(37)-N6)-dimethylallyltransferase MiaA [Ensifer soli]|uniref:tRNA (adenosine(37)-N6)-dimethylallyltransferase MiaA n=1 Tax=Ciceribacter sp. sgz301302 TaxID=3342379 RepID=UPI0035B92FFF
MVTIPDDETDAVLITGPTASGKSGLALAIARARGGVVINADSMQVYDTLRVLTARPDEAAMAGVPHRLYGHVPAGGAFSTGSWLRAAADLVAALRREGRLPVFVGGTGLYFRALTGGLAPMPDIPDPVRTALRDRLTREGALALHAELHARDPETAAQIGAADAQRILRALEVLEVSGEPLARLQRRSGPMVIDPARAQCLLVLPPRPVLYERIDRRFATMLEEGAIEEVRALLSLGLSPAMPVMKAIGVSQISALIAGAITREAAIEQGATATRHYAKRQMTWFRNQLDDRWRVLDGQTG